MRLRVQRTSQSMGSSCPLSYMKTQVCVCGTTAFTRMYCRFLSPVHLILV